MNSVMLVALLLAAAVVSRADDEGAREVVSFDTPAALRLVHPNNTRVAPVSEHAHADRKALRVEFLPVEWPSVVFRPETPWDWRRAGGLAIDITNPGKETLQFGVRADDDVAADGNVHCRTGTGSILPGKTATFLLPFGKAPMAYGMRALPPVPGMIGIGWQGSGAFDLGHIVAFQVFMRAPAGPKSLLLANLRLIATGGSLDKIVDAYGQYARADWPGKLHNVSEFATRLAAEDAALKATPTLSDRDGYCGWAAKQAPVLTATGWFRTENRNEK